MYDALSMDYDRFVNWPSRLAFEMPFIESQLNRLGETEKPLRVLDAACGTGMHVIALAERGFKADGADLSEKMVEKAKVNAATAGVMSRFKAAGFDVLQRDFADSLPYDAVLCLGNSLPHLTNLADLQNALNDFSACLKPGGMLLVQNRNFDAVMANHDRWMEPQAHEEENGEWLFVRFYDFAVDGLIDFNILTLYRTRGEAWQQRMTQTRLYPLKQVELTEALLKSGFTDLELFGGMNGQPFDRATSGNLIIGCRKG